MSDVKIFPANDTNFMLAFLMHTPSFFSVALLPWLIQCVNRTAATNFTIIKGWMIFKMLQKARKRKIVARRNSFPLFVFPWHSLFNTFVLTHLYFIFILRMVFQTNKELRVNSERVTKKCSIKRYSEICHKMYRAEVLKVSEKTFTAHFLSMFL